MHQCIFPPIFRPWCQVDLHSQTPETKADGAIARGSENLRRVQEVSVYSQNSRECPMVHLSNSLFPFDGWVQVTVTRLFATFDSLKPNVVQCRLQTSFKLNCWFSVPISWLRGMTLSLYSYKKHVILKCCIDVSLFWRRSTIVGNMMSGWNPARDQYRTRNKWLQEKTGAMDIDGRFERYHEFCPVTRYRSLGS